MINGRAGGQHRVHTVKSEFRLFTGEVLEHEVVHILLTAVGILLAVFGTLAFFRFCSAELHDEKKTNPVRSRVEAIKELRTWTMCEV